MCKKIGIFGSFVRGEESFGSDIDVIVEFQAGGKTFDNFMNLAFFLEELFGRKVDLMTLEGVSPFLFPYIEKEIIYEEL